MSAALLDVNVLIALFDRRHIHHDQAHTWLAQSAPLPWARCPITENAVLRILGNPRYPNSPGRPAVVAPLLQGWRASSRHRFWAHGLSLLALAVHHGGCLVTLDRRLQAELVEGGREALVVLDGT